MNEEEIVRERRLLNTWILRTSIVLCVAFIVVGLVLFFLHGGAPIQAMPSGSLGQLLRQTVGQALGLHASAFLEVGIILLLLTPMVRLAAGIYVSARVRDWLYAVIGLLVLGLVILGVIAGQSGV